MMKYDLVNDMYACPMQATMLVGDRFLEVGYMIGAGMLELANIQPWDNSYRKYIYVLTAYEENGNYPDISVDTLNDIKRQLHRHITDVIKHDGTDQPYPDYIEDAKAWNEPRGIGDMLIGGVRRKVFSIRYHGTEWIFRLSNAVATANDDTEQPIIIGDKSK